MSNVPEVQVLRSPAMERRLRLRRQDARLRLNLLSDVFVFGGHHASAAPRFRGPGHGHPVASSANVASLRRDLEATRTQLNALAMLLAALVLQPVVTPASSPEEVQIEET